MAILTVMAFPLPAFAQTEAPTITCAQARSMVFSNGAAVVHSSRNVYGRYVSDIRFCARGQTTKAAFIATRDNAYCPVGNQCVEQDRNRGIY
jgi:hypothetical protein